MDNSTAQFQREGEPVMFNLPTDIEKENSTAPQPEKTTKEPAAPRREENNEEKQKPLNENPRWQEREDDWKKRFDTQEQRHQDDLRKIREEVSSRKAEPTSTKIPTWFGGNQDQWDAYRADQLRDLQATEQKAYDRAKADYEAREKEYTQAETKQQELVNEATSYMQSELGRIQADTELNPSGEQIDANKFLKYVLENKFVDVETQKWDYQRAWHYYQLEQKANAPAPRPAPKTIAGATTSESRSEGKKAPFKTNADFKQRKPW